MGGKPAAGQRRHQGEDSGFENALQAGKINPASMQAVLCLNSYNTSPAPKRDIQIQICNDLATRMFESKLLGTASQLS